MLPRTLFSSEHELFRASVRKFLEQLPIARAWAAARVQRIYAGTNEIMKEIIARAL